MPPMIYVLIFLAVVLAVEGVASLAERAPQRRARHRAQAAAPDRAGHPEPGRPERGLDPARAPRGARSGCSTSTRLRAGRRRARAAPLPGRAHDHARAASLLLCVAIGLGAWLVGLDRASTARRIAFPFVLAGFLPFVQIARLRSQRMYKFEEQFPEALDLITRAMRAGHSLTFGFQMVGDELPDPIGAEFAQVAEEIKLGRELRVALGNLVYRVEAGDLPFFVTAITIQRETGGNLAEVLEKLGTLIRDRFALYGKVRALTAIGKASANLLAAMPLMLVAAALHLRRRGRPLLRGAAIHARRPGMMLSAVAVGLVVIGYILCRRMAQIEV